MRFLEFGQQNSRILVLFHASCMTWDFLKDSIERLSDFFHLIVPVLPGYDLENESDYTSIEKIQGCNHAEFLMLKPDAFSEKIYNFFTK